MSVRTVICGTCCVTAVSFGKKTSFPLTNFVHTRVRANLQYYNLFVHTEKFIHFKDLRKHVEDECRAKLVFCRRGCGVQLPRQAMPAHLTGDCSKRTVECRLGCGIQKMWLQERDAHERDNCPNRLVFCRLDCKKQVKFCEREAHEANDCEMRGRLLGVCHLRRALAHLCDNALPHSST